MWISEKERRFNYFDEALFIRWYAFCLFSFFKPTQMKKNTTKILIGIGIAAATGFIIYAVRRQQSSKRHARVADEGYETAHDILYPQKKYKRKKVQYGPGF
jgi:hypothetical protein